MESLADACLVGLCVTINVGVSGTLLVGMGFAVFRIVCDYFNMRSVLTN